MARIESVDPEANTMFKSRVVNELFSLLQHYKANINTHFSSFSRTECAYTREMEPNWANNKHEERDECRRMNVNKINSLFHSRIISP